MWIAQTLGHCLSTKCEGVWLLFIVCPAAASVKCRKAGPGWFIHQRMVMFDSQCFSQSHHWSDHSEVAQSVAVKLGNKPLNKQNASIMHHFAL